MSNRKGLPVGLSVTARMMQSAPSERKSKGLPKGIVLPKSR